MSVRFESMDADNVYAVCHDSQSNYNKCTVGRTVRVLRRIHIRLRPPVSRSQLALERVLFQFRIQPTMRLNLLARHKLGTEQLASLSVEWAGVLSR